MEIGAITPYLSGAVPRFPWLSYVHAIDLRSNHPTIKAIDYLDFGHEERNRLHEQLYNSCEINYSPEFKTNYDVIVCSMVINSVPEITARGAMLVKMAFDISFNGIAFIMLPKSCLYNSPSFSMQTFHKLLTALGFQIVEEKFSPKVYFVILKMINFYENKSKRNFQELSLEMKKIRLAARKQEDRHNYNTNNNSCMKNNVDNKKWTTSFDIDF